jgi:CRP-like cAMP-binding protein
VLDARALQLLPMFEGVEPAALEVLATKGFERSFGPGQTLLREGDPGDEVMIVLDGRADVAVGGHRVGEIGPGDCVGEMAVLDRAPRSATVTSSTALRVFVVPAERFADLLDTSPGLTARLTATLLNRLRAAQTEWAGLAGDPDVLLTALLDLQSSPDPSIAERARRQAAALVEATAAKAGPPRADLLAPLSPAERKVAELVAEGLSNGAIAERLIVSRHTVDTHVKRSFTKLGVHTRVELAALVLRSGGA